MAQYTLTNLLSNSSFENTGWGNTAYCTLSYDNTIKKYGNYSLKVTATRTSSGEVYFANSTNVNMVQNHIYYTRCELYQTSSVCSGMQAYWPQAEPNMGSASVSETNKWVKCSFRASRTNWSGSQNFRFDIENIVAPNYVYLDGAMLVDLTEAFGSGNEPSIEWCDSNIVYFEGTKTINASSITLRTKKSLPQEPYLESSGTQYIDTRFQPTNNTKVIVDFQCISGSSDPTIFGTWDSQINNAYIFLSLSAMSGGHGFYGTQMISYTKNMSLRHIIIADKNNWTLDNETIVSFSSSTFTSSYPMYLFAYNNAGTVGNLSSSIIIYSCQIYDNDILVRDFVPALDSSNVACLLDKVSNTYFYNQGSGVFKYGITNADTPYEIMTTNIGYTKMSGTWKPLVKWFAKVNGEWRLGV